MDSCPEGTSEDMCRSSAGSPICSDRGECVCGECHCDTMTCRSKCDTYRFCAECLAFGTGPLASQCETACGQVSVEKEDDPDGSATTPHDGGPRPGGPAEDGEGGNVEF
ncbi:Integrin beta-7 [Amphibalanus amphitrite]|uniref:Integrin beta-7 n=1 Tax=Amphibalanus amphitrite TaxID=1232801 RepID=A0A6A4W0R1_AMPAM|nr:Integrin beta-7 [Amphibalanus amphitrite]